MIALDKPNYSFCFCTAAFGHQYTQLAKFLADDLNKFAPGYPFVVFTDRPQLLQGYPNVIAIKHWCRGVQPYHERRFAIQYALSLAPSVMYLDADVRICAPITHNLCFEPGLTARSCANLQKHMNKRFKKTSEDQRKLHIVQQMAQRVGIDLNSPDLKFINEFLFVVTADAGRELDFLKLWGELAIYADTLGMYQHPTYAMALAASKSGFPISRSEMEGVDFFDDRIESIKISKGQSTPDAKAEYFKQQSTIEQKKKTRLQRLSKSLQRKTKVLYHRLRVQLTYTLSPGLLVNYPYLNSNSLEGVAHVK
jgi:hypothetical protein